MKWTPVGFFHGVHVDDVRMVQRGDRFGFALEAGEALTRGHLLRQNFERDFAGEFGVVGDVHVSHAAAA